MIKLLTDCQHCAGAGKIELQPHLRETLAEVVRAGAAGITAPQLHTILFSNVPEADRPSIPAMNARLNELEQHGYTIRHTEGRRVIYKLSAHYDALRVTSAGKFYFANTEDTHHAKPTVQRTRRGTSTRSRAAA